MQEEDEAELDEEIPGVGQNQFPVVSIGVGDGLTVEHELTAEGWVSLERDSLNALANEFDDQKS